MNKKDVYFMSACAIADAIKRQELTSVEITETFIERIEKFNSKTNAYCTTTFELAREQAKKADELLKKDEKIGLLNGVPISIKDLMEVEGVRTTFGSKLYEDYIPEMDEIAIQRLKAAGCVILGKTNAPEFGHMAVTDNLIFGKTLNPWNDQRTSGGSSGGAAAAVACGLGPLALGSDGGGSIRIPSCFCGVYGLKPNYGRIPIYPHIGIKWATLDHYGPIVRYVEDAALMLDVLKGPHDADKDSLPLQNISYLEELKKEKTEKLKIGYSMNLGFVKALDPEVEKNVLNAVQKFEQVGWNVEEVKIKLRNPEMAYSTLLTPGFAHDLKSKLTKWRENLSPNLVRLIEAGIQQTAIELESAMLKRRRMYDIFYKLFKNYDILITPTTAVPAFELEIMFPSKIGGKSASPLAWMSFTYPFNMTGHPAASVPCGWTSDGLPTGMQIVGKRFDEMTVLKVSKAFEELAPWQDKKPQLN